jgi:ADP-heptose:LPS heptosyltransferase
MKKVKDNIALLLYKMVLILVKLLPARRGEAHLLIIKTDEIGDYILFRSYLKYFKQQGKYKKYKLTLIGNVAWRQIFEAYDKETVDNTIWLNKKEFKKNLTYRFNFLKNVRGLQTSDVANCIFSRSIQNDDAIAWVAMGDYKAAMEGDNTNRGKDVDNWDKNIYTEIVAAGDQSVFDAIRNRNFISAILQIQQIPVENHLSVKSVREPLSGKYYVMFLGAGNPERKWPIGHFVEIASYVANNYDLIPVLCGGPDDKIDAISFIDRYQKEVIDYTGKTSLLQLTELLSNAQFLICVDTGALHIAAAVGCPVIGLYSGKFYGRFAPYPKEITEQFYPVYPDFVDQLIADKNPDLYDTFIMRNDTMKLISAAKIMPFIQLIMER